MAINIDVLIPVTSAVVNTSFNNTVLAGLFANKNALIPNNNTQKVLQFTTAAQVGAFFGLDSDEYAIAVKYFAAYVGTLNIPPFLYFARYIDEDIAPYIRGSAGLSLSDLQGITSGAVTLEFNGASLTSTGSAVATSTLPTDQVHWNDGTDDFLTVVNKTSATIGTYKMVSGAWVLQGSTVATGTVPTGIAYSNISGSHYVSVTNSTANTLGTYLWSGSAFSLISAAITTGSATTPTQVVSCVIGANHYLIVTNNADDSFTTYYWTGSAFAMISGTPTVSCGDAPTFLTQYLIGSTQYVSIVNSGAATVGTFSWDGAKFVSVGAAVATGTTPLGIESYAIGGFTYYTVVNSGADTIGTYKWSGTAFVSIGTAVATATLPADVKYFTINSQNYLAVTNTTSATLVTYLWDGTTWVQVNSVATGTAPKKLTAYYISGVPFVTVINTTAPTIGTYDFIVSGTALTGINLSAATSFSDVASILQSAYISAGISLGTVTYDSTTEAFTVSNGDVSGTGTVTYSPVTALATALKLTEASGATLSQGSVALSETANLTGFTAVTRNWLSFTNTWDLSDDDTYAVQIASTAWATNQVDRYVYILWTTESNLKISGNTSTVAQALVDAGYGSKVGNQVTYSGRVSPQFGLVDLAAAIMGTGAAINYNTPNGTLSFAYKDFTGIIPLVTDNDAYDALLQNGFNFYGIFDSKANSFNFTQNGSVGGIFKWQDFLYNDAWLASTLQDSIAAFFRSALEVPNNQIGYSQIRAIVNGVANQGISNGVITPGNIFSAATTATLKQQAGIDITRFLTQSGWYLQIIPVTPEQRANRQPPQTKFWYSNSGSIITLPLTAILVF